MKISKVITVETEVEIHVGSDDISLILDESKDINIVMRELNEIARFMNGIPDSIIKQLNSEQRKIVCKFFKAIIKRFDAE